MVIVTKFNGNQLLFTRYWCPLMYKHQECKFVVINPLDEVILEYPKDLENLEVVSDIDFSKFKTAVLECPMEKLPTYKAMIIFQRLSEPLVANPRRYKPEQLKTRFYKVNILGKKASVAQMDRATDF